MKFERKSFYGLNFAWWAVDATGAIAEFTSGGGPIPKSVFNDYTEYAKTQNFFDELPSITETFLAPSWIDEMKKRNYPFRYIEGGEQRGIYCFDEDDYTDDYLLLLMPKIELKLNNLPEEIQTYLTPFSFNDVVFSEQSKITLTDYFECVR